MLRFVYIDPRVSKQLDQLRKFDKKSESISKKAEEIIDRLAAGEVGDQAGTITRYGEHRIDNCIKYDLPAGYRLVVTWQESQQFVLYIGPHDACQRWIENNKGWKPAFVSNKGKWLSAEKEPSCCESSDIELSKPENNEESLTEITEKQLRTIFGALCGN